MQHTNIYIKCTIKKLLYIKLNNPRKMTDKHYIQNIIKQALFIKKINNKKKGKNKH